MEHKKMLALACLLGYVAVVYALPNIGYDHQKGGGAGAGQDAQKEFHGKDTTDHEMFTRDPTFTGRHHREDTTGVAKRAEEQKKQGSKEGEKSHEKHFTGSDTFTHDPNFTGRHHKEDTTGVAKRAEEQKKQGSKEGEKSHEKHFTGRDTFTHDPNFTGRRREEETSGKPAGHHYW